MVYSQDAHHCITTCSNIIKPFYTTLTDVTSQQSLTFPLPLIQLSTLLLNLQVQITFPFTFSATEPRHVKGEIPFLRGGSDEEEANLSTYKSLFRADVENRYRMFDGFSVIDADANAGMSQLNATEMQTVTRKDGCHLMGFLIP